MLTRLGSAAVKYSGITYAKPLSGQLSPRVFGAEKCTHIYESLPAHGFVPQCSVPEGRRIYSPECTEKSVPFIVIKSVPSVTKISTSQFSVLMTCRKPPSFSRQPQVKNLGCGHFSYMLSSFSPLFIWLYHIFCILSLGQNKSPAKRRAFKYVALGIICRIL